MHLTRIPVHRLMRTVPGYPTLYVPAAHKQRVLRLYGEWTFNDFDTQYRLNHRLGNIYPTSFDTLRHYMNLIDNPEYLQMHYDTLPTHLQDSFNLVQSAVGSRVGETFWCV